MSKVTRILPAIEQGDPHADEQKSHRRGPRVARFGGIDRCHKPQMRNLLRSDTPKQTGTNRTGAPLE